MSKLATDLPGLQNLIKRDPAVYHDEFMQQYAHFQTELEIFKMNAAQPSPSFDALLKFMGHVAQCYPEELKDYPSTLFSLMDEMADVMNRDTRIVIIKVLILLRNKGLIELIPLLKSFFHYFRINDKQLRALLYTHIITAIGSANKGKVNENLNRQLKSFMFDLLNSDNELVARKALDVMVELYRRQVWTDARSVNVIAAACLSKHTRVMIGGIRFFLGIETRIEEDEEKEKEIKVDEIDQHAHSHKTRARKRDTQRQIAERRRKLRRANELTGQPRFPAIALVYDPQGFCEKLLNVLKRTKEQFSVRLLLMDVISRFVGYHKLCLFPFYAFLQSYLTAHQQQVTRILVFLVQSCHDYVPPEELVPLVRVIADNFVSDRAQPEVIALGINTLSEMFLRVPLLFQLEELEPLIHELVDFRTSRDKGVMVAARNFLNNARRIYPLCLRKKDRGKDSEKTARPLAYGEEYVRDAMEGMEALGEAIERGEVPLEAEDKAEDWEEERKRMNCEGEEVVIKKWEPVPVTRELEEKVMGRREDAALLASESESEEVPQLVESEEENDDENDENDENDDEVEEEDNEDNKEEYNEDNEDNEDNEEMEEENEDTTKTTSKAEQEAAAAKEREEVRQRRIAMARKVLSTRVLTPKDYRILNGDESSSSDEEVEVANAMHHDAVVDPSDLLGYQKKRKDSIEERRRKVMEGRKEF
ncbi:hypothetical protein WA538_005386, partial [Blastocystis sp. DL]